MKSKYVAGVKVPRTTELNPHLDDFTDTIYIYIYISTVFKSS